MQQKPHQEGLCKLNFILRVIGGQWKCLKQGHDVVRLDLGTASCPWDTSLGKAGRQIRRLLRDPGER